MTEVEKRLKDVLIWSDRLGSDEKNEIKEIIKLVKLLTP
jgi:hypothetical protein